MRRVRCRWLFPIGHLLIDTAVLIFWIWHAQVLFRHIKGGASLQTHVLQPVMMQEAGAPGWDFRWDEPIEPSFQFLAWGNAPTAFVSGIVRPRAYLQTRKKSWDPIWFVIHESLSCSIWFGLGAFADAGHKRLAKLMTKFLGMRILFAAFVRFEAIARLGALLEFLFWFAFAICAVAWVARSADRRMYIRNTNDAR